MLKRLNPEQAPEPFSRYAQAVAVPEQFQWLYISGQVGCGRDHKPASGFEAQARLALRNLVTVLEGSGFAIGDLVKLTVFLTSAQDVALWRKIRDEAIRGIEPASTLVVVQALASPDWLIEVEGVAAKAA